MHTAVNNVLTSLVVGPPTDVLKKMGDKVTARHIARSCNIPTIPGTGGPVQNIQEAYDFVHRHGYPVVVKASFGGESLLIHNTRLVLA